MFQETENLLGMMLFICDDAVKRCMQGGILAFLYSLTSLSICFCFDDMFYEFMK